MLTPQLSTYCNSLVADFQCITESRKELLKKLSDYIQQKINTRQSIQLVYICTHNSRRSQFGQIWAVVAAKFYRIQQLSSFSGGTEVTAFHPNAIAALKRIGFKVQAVETVTNPEYKVYYSELDFVTCYSKVYNDVQNPKADFVAIMTCSEAEENCPFIPGAELRIGTTYEDPKLFDGTEQMESKYDERCKQIALETFYVFSQLKSST